MSATNEASGAHIARDYRCQVNDQGAVTVSFTVANRQMQILATPIERIQRTVSAALGQEVTFSSGGQQYQTTNLENFRQAAAQAGMRADEIQRTEQELTRILQNFERTPQGAQGAQPLPPVTEEELRNEVDRVLFTGVGEDPFSRNEAFLSILQKLRLGDEETLSKYHTLSQMLPRMVPPQSSVEIFSTVRALHLESLGDIIAKLRRTIRNLRTTRDTRLEEEQLTRLGEAEGRLRVSMRRIEGPAGDICRLHEMMLEPQQSQSLQGGRESEDRIFTISSLIKDLPTELVVEMLARPGDNCCKRAKAILEEYLRAHPTEVADDQRPGFFDAHVGEGIPSFDQEKLLRYNIHQIREIFTQLEQRESENALHSGLPDELLGITLGLAVDPDSLDTQSLLRFLRENPGVGRGMFHDNPALVGRVLAAADMHEERRRTISEGGHVPSLEEILPRLIGNASTGLLAELRRLDTLPIPVADRATFTGVGLPEMPAVTSMDFQGYTELTRRGSLVRSFPNIENAYFSNSNMNDNQLERCQYLEHLTSLNLNNCSEITGNGFRRNRNSISSNYFPSLREVDLGSCSNLSDSGLRCLATIDSLDTLRLSNCPKITGSGVGALSRLPRLAQLDISGSAQVTGAAFAPAPPPPGPVAAAAAAPAAHFTSLQSLTVAHARWQDNDLQDLRHLQGLATLDLRDGQNFTDRGIEHLRSLPLRTLNLSGCARVTGVAFERSGRGDDRFATLSRLNLSNTGLTDDGLQHLASYSNLTHLDLRNCAAVTPAAIEQFQRARDRYRELRHLPPLPIVIER